MSGSDTHYEVYFRNSPTDQWKMLGAESSKQLAIDEARDAMRDAPNGSVKVVKEVFEIDTGMFVSNTVFREGEQSVVKPDRADKQDDIPCSAPDQLIATAGREAIKLALREWLAQEQSLVLELVHNPKLVDRLEASGTVMQHAVQSYAVARADEREASVQHYIKQLNALIGQATQILYQDTRAESVERLTPEKVHTVLERLSERSDRERRLKLNLAFTLGEERDWYSKGEKMIGLINAIRQLGDDHRWARGIVERFLEEFIGDYNARSCLIEPPADLGQKVDALTAILCGRTDAVELLKPLGRVVAGNIKHGRFKRCQLVLARDVVGILQTPKRLRPSDVFSEIDLVRRLADSMIASAGHLLSPDSIANAFTTRSAQLVQHDAMTEIAKARPHPEDALNALVEMERSVVGMQNKVKIADYIISFATSFQAKNHFVFGQQPLLARLSALGKFDERVRASTFPETEKIRIGRTLTAIGEEINRETEFFRRIDGAKADPLDKALEHLRLVENRVLPKGALWAEAYKRAKRLLNSPSGQESLASGTPETVKKLKRIQAIMRAMGLSKTA